MFVNECLVGLFYDLIFGGFFMGAIVGFLYTSIYFGLFVIVFFKPWNWLLLYYIESVSIKVAIILGCKNYNALHRGNQIA